MKKCSKKKANVYLVESCGELIVRSGDQAGFIDFKDKEILVSPPN